MVATASSIRNAIQTEPASGLDIGLPKAKELNDLADASPRKQVVAAEDTPIPITWGRDRQFGKVSCVAVHSGYLYLRYTFGRGPIQEFETVFVDGVDASDSGGFLSVSGASIERYTGTSTQGVSPLLSAAIDGYSDTLRGYAYLVLRVPTGAATGFPRVEAIIKGQKVYDPRNSALLGGDILRLALGTSIQNSLRTTSLTAEAWIRIRDGWDGTDSAVDIIDNMDRVDEGWLLGVTSAGELQFRLYTDTSGASHQVLTTAFVRQLTDEAIHHVAATYSSSDRTMRIYLDAVEVASQTLSGLSNYNINWEGNRIDLEFGTGGNIEMQEVRIWGVVRSASEIRDNYRRRLAGSEDDLVGYWPIYERSGSAIRDFAGSHTMTRNSSALFGDAFKGLHPSSSSSTVYSANPSLCFADFLSRFSDRSVRYDSVIEAAQANDEMVGGSPRREIGWTINTPRTIDSWIKAWRVYAGVYIGWDDREVVLVPAARAVEAQGAVEFDGSSNTYASITSADSGRGGTSEDLRFRLTVMDDNGQSDTDEVIVAVNY